MADVNDVAAYVVNKLGSMSTMKLQKLCYYAQGWALAWDEKPLFEARIEAWANGPVIYDLFQKHRGQFQISSWSHGHPADLEKSEIETIDAVLQSYGHLSGQELSDLTHGERPWVEARGTTSPGVSSNSVISLDSMQDFFGALDHEIYSKSNSGLELTDLHS
jgi:uncharacterized phage-associated protein